MIIVLGSVVAHAGRFDEALALSEEHVARSRAEPGCIAHAVHRDTENPHRLVFVERWSSREALWAHFAVPASRAFGKALAGLAVEAPTIELFEASAVDVPGRPS
jgi:quinol monooxygenase YgiN